MELVTTAWIAAALGVAKVGTTAGLLAFFARRRRQRSGKADATSVQAADSEAERLLVYNRDDQSLKDR
jgi:hypothetical protein